MEKLGCSLVDCTVAHTQLDRSWRSSAGCTVVWTLASAAAVAHSAVGCNCTVAGLDTPLPMAPDTHLAAAVPLLLLAGIAHTTADPDTVPARTALHILHSAPAGRTDCSDRNSLPAAAVGTVQPGCKTL